MVRLWLTLKVKTEQDVTCNKIGNTYDTQNDMIEERISWEEALDVPSWSEDSVIDVSNCHEESVHNWFASLPWEVCNWFLQVGVDAYHLSLLSGHDDQILDGHEVSGPQLHLLQD